MSRERTVRIQDATGTTTHWETCRHADCITYDCPRFERCCGVVS